MGWRCFRPICKRQKTKLRFITAKRQVSRSVKQQKTKNNIFFRESKVEFV